MNSRREKILDILDEMPEEAFGYFVVAAGSMVRGVQIWPDGLGGFIPDSKKSIIALQSAANEYIKNARSSGE